MAESCQSLGAFFGAAKILIHLPERKKNSRSGRLKKQVYHGDFHHSTGLQDAILMPLLPWLQGQVPARVPAGQAVEPNWHYSCKKGLNR